MDDMINKIDILKEDISKMNNKIQEQQEEINKLKEEINNLKTENIKINNKTFIDSYKNLRKGIPMPFNSILSKDFS